MAMNKMSVLIMGFIVILVGIVLLSSLADNESSIRTLVTVTDDPFTGSNSTCTRVSTGCIYSITSVENGTSGGTEVIGTANYSICRSSTTNVLDGILLAAGSQYNGQALSGETLNATYEHSPGCMYISSSVSRTFISLIPLFFALAVLLIGIGIFIKSKEGVF